MDVISGCGEEILGFFISLESADFVESSGVAGFVIAFLCGAFDGPSGSWSCERLQGMQDFDRQMGEAHEDDGHFPEIRRVKY